MTVHIHERPLWALDDKTENAAAVPAGGGQAVTDGAEMHDRLLFEQAHKAIVDGRLYLNPGFSRKTYIKLCLTNKNRVAQLVRRYAGTNLSGYINGMRLEYAAWLLDEKPGLPIKTVAFDSGFRSLRTFYRLFAAKYGVTPTKYRDSL